MVLNAKSKNWRRCKWDNSTTHKFPCNEELISVINMVMISSNVANGKISDRKGVKRLLKVSEFLTEPYNSM